MARRRKYKKMPVWLQPSEWPVTRFVYWVLGQRLARVRIVDEFEVGHVFTQIFEHRKSSREAYHKSRFRRIHGNVLKFWFTDNYYDGDLLDLSESALRVWSKTHGGRPPAGRIFRAGLRPGVEPSGAGKEKTERFSMREIDRKAFGHFKGVLYAQELPGGGTVGYRVDLVREGPVGQGDIPPVYQAASWWADAIPFDIEARAIEQAGRGKKPVRWSAGKKKEEPARKQK